MLAVVKMMRAAAQGDISSTATTANTAARAAASASSR